MINSLHVILIIIKKNKNQKRLTKGKGRKGKVIAAKIKTRHFQPKAQDRLREKMGLKLLQSQSHQGRGSHREKAGSVG